MLLNKKFKYIPHLRNKSRKYIEKLVYRKRGKYKPRGDLILRLSETFNLPPEIVRKELTAEVEEYILFQRELIKKYPGLIPISLKFVPKVVEG